MDRPSKDDREAPSRTPRSKKPYTAPRLVEYGSVAKLTQTGGTTMNEPHGFKRPCL